MLWPTRCMQIKGLPRKNEEKHNHWLVWNAASAFLGLSACLRSFLPTLLYTTPLRHLSDLAIAFFSDTSPLQNSSPILFLDTSLHQSSSTLLCNTLLQHVLNSLPLHFSATILLQHFNALLLHFSTTPLSYTSL